MNDEIERNHELANHFKSNEVKVHISKEDGIFYNGIILEVKPDFFLISDVEDGSKLIFFKELAKPIEKFKEKEEAE